MFRGPMGPPQGGMMGGPQGMPGRGGGWGSPGMRGPGGVRPHVLRPGDEFWEPGMGNPGMRGPQDMVQPGGPWQQPGGQLGGAFPNMPPQLQGGPPAGGMMGGPGMGNPGMGGFRQQPGFISGGRDDPSMGGSGYWGGGRGMPGGMGGRPQAGPPVPRRPPMREYR